MAAGGSDYSGVTQGGIGQGFAQGVQQGTDNYNKGVDRKAAQANTYLTQFIGPNLQNLSKGIPRPPAGAPQAEIDAWVKAEDARRRQIQVLLGQSDKYLKATGSPITSEEWAGLFYDPNSALSSDEWGKIQKSYGKYASVDTNVRKLQSELLALDPTEQTELYNAKLKQYNDYKAETGYEQLWTDINGGAYKEFVGGPDELAARRNDKVTRNNNVFLQAAVQTVKDERGVAFINQLISSGVNLDAIDPATGATYRAAVNKLVDGEGLDNLINSGNEQGYSAALQRIESMSEQERTQLPDAAKRFWSQVQQYRSDPAKVPEGPFKAAMQKYTLVGQEVQKGGITLNIMGVDYNTKSLNYTAAFGELAQQGNQAVLQAKDEFLANLPATMTAEQKEQEWQKSVVNPLNEYEAKQKQNFQVVQQQLIAMTSANVKAIDDTVTAGRFHLTTLFNTDASGKVTINKDSEIYKNLVRVEGNVSDATLMARYESSLTNFNRLETKAKNELLIGAAAVRSAEANATSAEVEANWAELFASQKWEASNYATIVAKAQAQIAPAQARGELSVLMAQAVKANGVGVLEDAEFKRMFTEVLGETGYANAKVYLTRQQEYEQGVQKNQLKIQGQQITAANNDEFDRMFKSPSAIAMYLAQPGKVEQIARAAGINPAHAMSALAQLDRERRTLNDLQTRSMRFDMYARQQGIDLQVRSQNFAEERAAVGDRQWTAQFDRGVYESNRAFRRGVYEDDRDFNAAQDQLMISNGFTSRNLDLEYAKFDDMRTFRDTEFTTNLVRDARDYAFRVKAQASSDNLALQQIKAAYLPSLNAKLDIVQSQLNAATSRYNEVVESQDGTYASFIKSNVIWKKQPDGTYKAAPKNASVQSTFNALKQKGILTQLEDAYNVRNNLEIELETGKTLYGELIDTFQDVFKQPIGDLPTAVNNAQLSASTGKATKQDFNTYQKTAPTKQGSDIAAFVQSAISGGQSKTYPNITTRDYCTTFVQALMANTMNVPSGIPIGGKDGANGFMNGLLARGAPMIPGKGAGGTLAVSDLKNLPDGTILFQKDGTREGHTAVVIGGMVVQNSRYTDNKLAGAIGTMSLEAFVKAAPTVGVQIPDSWYKNGTGVNPKATSTVTVTKPAVSTSKPAATTPVSSRYSDGNGGFSADLASIGTYVSSQIGNGKGVRIASSPGGNSGLALKTGANRYAIITNDTVALQAVGRIGAQFGTYFAQTQKAPLATAYRQNPQGVRNALVVELKNAGFTGNINRYVDMWIKSKGWN